MSIVAPVHSLDAFTIKDACTPQSGKPIRIDLRQCTFISPAGLVFLGTLMEESKRRGRPAIMRFDPASDLAKYMERMGLRRIAEECDVPTTDFPKIRHHPSAERFVELTRFSASGDSVIDDVTQAMKSRISLLGPNAKPLHNAVFELGVNVEQHAQSTGLVAVQNYPRRRAVEIAVGDCGVGIRQSLADGGIDLETHGEAIWRAVETSASRFQADNTGRGAGLPWLRRQLCGDDWRGYLIVQSGDERIVWQHGQETQRVKLRYRLPGTLAFGMLRTS